MNIALYSNTMQAGKSTVAEYLTTQGYTHIKFARILKDMLRVFLANFVDDPWEYLEGDKKEVIIPELGVTTRYLMQTLGTEYGREIVHRDVWVIATLNNLDPDKNYVIDDMRFPNEYTRLQELGFVMVKLVGRGQLTNQHQSEGQLDNYDFDYIIENSGTVGELLAKVDKIINEV